MSIFAPIELKSNDFLTPNNCDKMDNKDLNGLSIRKVVEEYNIPSIGDEMILFDHFNDVPLPNEPRRMECSLFAICLKGKAQYTVNTNRHTVKENDVIIVNEGQVVGDYMLSRDCEGIAIMLSEEFLNEITSGINELSSLFLFSRNHPVFSLDASVTKTMLGYLGLIKQKMADTEHLFRRDTVRMLITTMICDLSNTVLRVQKTTNKKPTRAEAIFTDFIRLVEQNYKSERRVGWYGQQLCITPKYLSETVKAISGRTPNEWIDNYVVLEMRVQLKNSMKSIKDIANDLNFPNQSFMGKYFKEHVGMSPSDYRKS